MMENAALRLRRLLTIIPHLADGEEHSLDDVAGRVGADAETVLHDLRAVAVRFDEPGGFVEGVQIFIEADSVSLVTNHFHRPMRLTRTELAALELGLAMLRHERAPQEHAAIDRARQRLRAALTRVPPDEGFPSQALEATTARDVIVLAKLRRAIRDRLTVQLSYRGARDAAASQRVIRPYALIAARGAWFAIAYCERAEGLRVFRVDRIEDAGLLSEHFEADQDFSVEEFIRDGRVFGGMAAAALRIRYGPRIARWIAEREGLTCDEDGSVTVQYPLADEDWAVRHVLQYGPDVDVLEPAAVRSRVRERLSLIVASGT